MRKPLFRLLTVLAAALPLNVLGADLVGLYGLAKQGDPQLRSAQAAYAATREGAAQARALLYPDIRLSASTTKNKTEYDAGGSSDYTNKGWTLSLTQPLYRRDRFVSVTEGDLQTKKARFDLTAAEQALIVRLSERYFDVLAANDNLDFAQAEETAIQRELDQTRQRFEVGLIAVTDVHVAQARYDLAVAQKLSATNQLANARESLREVTGQYHSQLAKLSVDVPLVKPNPADVDAWGKSAIEQNPTIAAVQISADTARTEIDRLRSGHYPTVDLVASRNHSDVGGGSSGAYTADTNSLSLQLVVPLYQGGLVTSQVRQAEQLYNQALEGLEQQRRAVELQTRSAYLGVEASISQVKALEQALVSSKSALKATEAGFEVGTRTIVDVLDAQRDLFSAQRDLDRARYDYVLNGLRLKQAAGSLKEADLQEVNRWLK